MPSSRFMSEMSTMKSAMVWKMAPSSGVAKLKWLVVPRTTCSVINVVSIIKPIPVTLAAACTQRRRPCTRVRSHRKVMQ